MFPRPLLALAMTMAIAPAAFAQNAPAGKLKIEAARLASRYDDFKAALDVWARSEIQRTSKLLKKYRVLAFDELKDGVFTASLYDYAQDKVIRVEGSVPKVLSKNFWKSGKKWSLKVVDAPANRLPPTMEELEAAKKLVRSKMDLTNYSLSPAMPGTLSAKAIQQATAINPATGKSLVTNGAIVMPTERVVNVALKPKKNSGAKPEIVSVSLSSDQLVRYQYSAPPTAIASAADAQDAVQALTAQGQPRMEFARGQENADGTCGLEEDTDSVSQSRGTPGSATITVKTPAGDTLWQFDVIRPTASSGFWGSGIELRNVSYKGTPVLKRGHVPIFNVQYLNNACGPYRDWAYEENRFKANAQNILVGDATQGIVETSEMPQTILQSGSDFGNFTGVAIYTDEHQKTTLMTEMAAGWYRYVMMWTFYPDGSFQPQFGFGAIENACVCNRHFHHAYWRLEFPNTKFEKSPLGQDAWKVSDLQETFARDGMSRYRVSGGEGKTYEIVPGPRDGTASQPKLPGDTVDKFAKSDMWIMNANDDQVDDSALSADDSNDWGESIHISQFLKKQGAAQNDKLEKGLVVWYGTHFIHDLLAEPTHIESHTAGEGDDDHIVGPMIQPLKPVN
jgi:hypothetical protein